MEEMVSLIQNVKDAISTANKVPELEARIEELGVALEASKRSLERANLHNRQLEDIRSVELKRLAELELWVEIAKIKLDGEALRAINETVNAELARHEKTG